MNFIARLLNPPGTTQERLPGFDNTPPTIPSLGDNPPVPTRGAPDQMPLSTPIAPFGNNDAPRVETAPLGDGGFTLWEPQAGDSILFADDNASTRTYEASDKHHPQSNSLIGVGDEVAQDILRDGIQLPGETQVYGHRDGKYYTFQEHRPGIYHGYEVPGSQLPIGVRRQLRAEGRITNAEYNDLRTQSSRPRDRNR